jgi:GR25 family glycosyltransferase involved in LPS biosynthesis
MKIYVLHSSNLAKRKKHILEQFRLHNIYNFEFIEKYNVSEITDDECSIFDENYKKTKMSLFLKHIYCYQLIIKDHNTDASLIFEDDIILSDDFNDILSKYIKELPKDYNMLFIGCGYDLHIDKQKLIDDKHIYENPYSRCTDSYIITNNCAQQIYEYFINGDDKIKLPIDFWLNKVIADKELKVYWSEPTIVSQGSQTGLFKVSI